MTNGRQLLCDPAHAPRPRRGPILADFGRFWQTLNGPFSAVSTPIFITAEQFSSSIVFEIYKIYIYILAPLETENLAEQASYFLIFFRRHSHFAISHRTILKLYEIAQRKSVTTKRNQTESEQFRNMCVAFFQPWCRGFDFREVWNAAERCMMNSEGVEKWRLGRKNRRW